MTSYAAQNLDKFLVDSQCVLLLGYIFSHSIGSTAELSEAIAQRYATPYTPDSGHILDCKPMRVVRNKMLNNDSTGKMVIIIIIIVITMYAFVVRLFNYHGFSMIKLNPSTLYTKYVISWNFSDLILYRLRFAIVGMRR